MNFRALKSSKLLQCREKSYHRAIIGDEQQCWQWNLSVTRLASSTARLSNLIAEAREVMRDVVATRQRKHDRKANADA